MKTALATLLVGSLALSACSRVQESRLNPFNWFGKSESSASTLAPKEGYSSSVIDNRALVEQVSGLEATPTQGGALIVARGLPATQGWWDAELVAADESGAVDGVLTYTFRVAEPRKPRPAAPASSREVTAAVFLSPQKLQGVRQIVVIGASNSRTISR